MIGEGMIGCVTLRISTRALDKEGVIASTKLGRIESSSADFSSLMAAAITWRARIGDRGGRVGERGAGDRLGWDFSSLMAAAITWRARGEGRGRWEGW